VAYLAEDPPLTYDEIAEREGGQRTKIAYAQQARKQARNNGIVRHPRAGVPIIKWTDAELKRLAAYRAENPPLTYDEIAQREGGRRTSLAYAKQAQELNRQNGTSRKRGFNNVSQRRTLRLSKVKGDFDAQTEEDSLSVGSNGKENIENESTMTTETDVDGSDADLEDSGIAEKLNATRAYGAD
jgi:hypothetical protein